MKYLFLCDIEKQLPWFLRVLCAFTVKSLSYSDFPSASLTPFQTSLFKVLNKYQVWNKILLARNVIYLEQNYCLDWGMEQHYGFFVAGCLLSREKPSEWRRNSTGLLSTCTKSCSKVRSCDFFTLFLQFLFDLHILSYSCNYSRDSTWRIFQNKKSGDNP